MYINITRVYTIDIVAMYPARIVLRTGRYYPLLLPCSLYCDVVTVIVYITNAYTLL